MEFKVRLLKPHTIGYSDYSQGTVLEFNRTDAVKLVVAGIAEVVPWPTDTPPPSGMSLREAFETYADEQLWAKYCVPGLSTAARERVWGELYDDLREHHLRPGRDVVACGRSGSPTAPLTEVPGGEWQHISPKSRDGDTFEGSAKAWYGVIFYPCESVERWRRQRVLHDKLTTVGLSPVEALEVLTDPQKHAEYELLKHWDIPILIFDDSWEDVVSTRARGARRILRDDLFGRLLSGELVAFGFGEPVPLSGKRERIAPELWDDLQFDGAKTPDGRWEDGWETGTARTPWLTVSSVRIFRAEDVADAPSKREPAAESQRLSDVETEAGQPAQVERDEKETAHKWKGISHAKRQARIRKCAAWFRDQAKDGAPPKMKREEYRALAMEKFSLSGRAVDQARKIGVSDKLDWTKPGPKPNDRKS